MPTSTRTFRVFVSSTFNDLRDERIALAAPGGPFAELTKVCERYGARFQAIDLRWGVHEEAAHDQRTMEICLGEIERCQRTGIKPNFIILLGDRYGWQPLPSRIPEGEFEAVRECVADAKNRKLLDQWYELDTNAIPHEFLLKPRTGEFKDKEKWEEVEKPLHRALRDAASAVGFQGAALVKYEASATHQEILKGLGSTSEDRKHVFAFFRTAAKSDEDQSLRNLKGSLTSQLDGNVHTFKPGDFTDLCKHVRESLERIILSEIQGFESHTALDLERKAHNAFGRNRRRHFKGRQAELDGIAAYIRGGSSRPLVVYGASGSGKSAIMARASALAAAASRSAVIVRRFVGATPESSNGLTLLQSICEEIAVHCNGPKESSGEFSVAVSALRQGLSLATAKRPLYVFIDALDNLGARDPASSLTWLAADLPEHCRVVVSMIDVPPALRAVERVGVALLPQGDAEKALSAWLDDAQRSLRPEQRTKVLDYFSRCSLPLYLKLAFEEARRWKSFDAMEACELGEGLAGIIDVLFDRLSGKVNHGKFLVSRSLEYLAASRYGLTEDEILNVLSVDAEVWKEFDRAKLHDPPDRRLPVIVWSRLFLDLEPYLMERAALGGTVLTFYHRQLPERIASRWLAGAEAGNRHGALAKYFREQADPDHNQRWKGGNPRPFAELPYHLRHAELWPLLEATLADPVFCEANLKASGPFELRAECQRARQFQPSSAISAVERAITSGLTALLERPDLGAQTLVNRLASLAGDQPVIKPALKRAIQILDERGRWVQAETAYPRMDIDSSRVPFQTEATAQCLSIGEQCIVVVGEDRRARFLDQYEGSLREERDLPNGTGQVISIQSMDVGGRMAWLESGGILRSEQSPRAFQVRQSEKQISSLSGHALVAVSEGGDLVGWNPDTGFTSTLAKAIPEPTTVLRADGDGHLLCVAGKSPQRVLVLANDNRLELRLDLAWQHAPIVDADIDWDSQTILLLCRDRSLRRIRLHGGESLVEPFQYEQGKPATIWGAPLRCAAGSLDSAGWAFFATNDGQAGAWNWDSKELRRLPDWRTEQQRTINMFRCQRTSGHLVVGLQSEGYLLTQSSQRRRDQYHRGPVDACAVTGQGQIVSASEYDGTVCWFNPGFGLQLRVRQNHRGVTALASVPGSDDVLLGNQSGWCWRQPPDRDVSNEEVFCLFDRKVAALTSRDDRTMVAADVAGAIMLLEAGSEDAVGLRHGSGSVRQLALQPATAPAVCWSLHETGERGDLTHRLSLLGGANSESEVLRDSERLVCLASAPDQHLICIGGRRVRILKIPGDRPSLPSYRRDAAVRYTSFAGNGQQLAVILHDSPWLEILDVISGLPTVAAADLPGKVTCFAAHGDLMVVGFESGELLKFRLRGALGGHRLP